ncbi:MAG TPA: dihydroneopterin aldolase [Rhodanobacteraceae bacterium]
MDKVFIEDLGIETVIGAYDWERSIRQHVVLDIRMDYDCRKAGVSDALADALDYNAVAKAVTAHVEAAQCELVEALAEQVAQLVLREFAVERVRVQLRKPGAVGHARAVGVDIERTRS